MRWIWTFAIACIIAATGVRPEVRDEPTSQQLSVPASLQHLAARPHGRGAPETRVSMVAIVAAPFALRAPLARVTTSAWQVRAARSQLVVDPRARGPPPSIG